jgi:chromosome partitioning protein
MRVIAILAHKGGTGKTTTAQNLAFRFAKEGERVALIDLDWQGNASRGLGINPYKVENSIYSLMKRDVYPDYENITEDMVKVHKHGIDIYPAEPAMADFDTELGGEAAKESFIKNIISEWDYDRIIIDCHPDYSALTKNAYVAADEVYIPVETDVYSLDGLGFLLKELNKVQKRKLNDKLKVGGVLITQVNDRMTQFKETVEGLEKYFPKELFKTYIRKAEKDIRDAAKKGIPLCEYKPDHKVSEDYANLVKEILAREAANG